MTISIEVLRERLAVRENSLSKIRSQVETAKKRATGPVAKSSISDIQKRYLSAVADLETKGADVPKPAVRSTADGVSNLASRWNKGIDGKQVEKTKVDVRGDVNNARKSFTAKDVPTLVTAAAAKGEVKKKVDGGPAEIEVEDGSEVPSWAKNQRKMVIRKENARSSIRDVDVKELQGTVLEQGSRDGSEAERTKVEVTGGGNVKAALAMWGKTADEDAQLLAKRKEEEEKRKVAEARARKEREEERKKRALEAAVAKLSTLSLSDMREEPTDEIELIAFLERKIALIEKEIGSAEDELAKLEASH